MTVITNDIEVSVYGATPIEVALGDETVNAVYLDFNDTPLDVAITTGTGINVEVGQSGPPGSGLGTMLQDYSIKGQFFNWNGIGNVNVDYGNTVQIILEDNTVMNPVTGWPGIGEEGKLTLYVKQGNGPYDIVWPAGILWVNGSTPTLTRISGRWDVIILTTVDAGATVFGFHVGVTS